MIKSKSHILIYTVSGTRKMDKSASYCSCKKTDLKDPLANKGLDEGIRYPIVSNLRCFKRTLIICLSVVVSIEILGTFHNLSQDLISPTLFFLEDPKLFSCK